MKKRFSVAAILLLIGVALFLLFNQKEPAPVPAPLSNQNPPVGKTLDFPNALPISSIDSKKIISSRHQSQPSTLADKAGQRVTQSSPDAALPPEAGLKNVRQAIHQYGEMFGGNPVGTNPEITAQLSGSNSRRINFITVEAGMRVNADGALVDSWGTPYFFHQISGAEMEILSAGPDRVMWTSDDLVVK
jgi:hypothetical protein